MRNGVGPAGHLRDKGIEVIAQLPGVGENLMDHPHISVGTSSMRSSASTASWKASPCGP